MGLQVAVVGVTGAVGQEILDVLARRSFPVEKLHAFASPRSVGRRLRFGDGEIAVEALPDDPPAGLDLALLSAGKAISRALAPRWAKVGALVVDNSSAFRMDPDVPLVIPEVNPDAARGLRSGIIANPNCTTAISLMALAPLHRAAGLVRVRAASYQAASGAGAVAVRELEGQARAFAADRPLRASVFAHPLLFNCLPLIGGLLPDGSTDEEAKLLRESRKILDHPELLASATCVRVPVRRAHSIALFVELERALTPDEAREVLAAQPGLTVLDDPAGGLYPMPSLAAGCDEVLVGRIRRDGAHPKGLALWVVGDQLLKGAALNAVQCAELALGLGAW